MSIILTGQSKASDIFKTLYDTITPRPDDNVFKTVRIFL
uniref:Uncharacterized protein n=1 Tax=Lepeophtheirus salmonis TaxID=72036 RepID=A0A0K2V1E3_LEPSM